MKKSILKACFSLCLLAISSSVYAMDNRMSMDNRMAGASSDMMFMHSDLTENDLYSQLNAQDRAIYDKLDAQQREFVVRLINAAPQIQVMHQRMRGQGQFQGQGQGQYQERGFNRSMQQSSSSDYQR